MLIYVIYACIPSFNLLPGLELVKKFVFGGGGVVKGGQQIIFLILNWLRSAQQFCCHLAFFLDILELDTGSKAELDNNPSIPGGKV